MNPPYQKKEMIQTETEEGTFKECTGLFSIPPTLKEWLKSEKPTPTCNLNTHNQIFFRGFFGKHIFKWYYVKMSIFTNENIKKSSNVYIKILKNYNIFIFPY